MAEATVEGEGIARQITPELMKCCDQRTAEAAHQYGRDAGSS